MTRIYCYAACRYAEYRDAECCYAECIMLNVVMLSAVMLDVAVVIAVGPFLSPEIIFAAKLSFS